MADNYSVLDGTGASLTKAAKDLGGLVKADHAYIADGNDLAAGATADAIVAAGAAGSISAKLRRVTQGLEDLKTLVVLAAGSNLLGKVGIDQTSPGGTNAVQSIAGVAGGYTPSHRVSTADTNAVSLKASAGQVGGLQLTNVNAAARYFKLYDKASVPTVGTDTPKKVICVPGGSTAQPSVVVLNQPLGIVFATGIAFAVTAGLADADATAIAAGDMLIEVDWK